MERVKSESDQKRYCFTLLGCWEVSALHKLLASFWVNLKLILYLLRKARRINRGLGFLELIFSPIISVSVLHKGLR